MCVLKIVSSNDRNYRYVNIAYLPIFAHVSKLEVTRAVVANLLFNINFTSRQGKKKFLL